MPPLRSTRTIHYTIRSRAGHTPPLPRGVFLLPRGKALPPWGKVARFARRMRGNCPAVAPSSVTFGDSFPRGGSHTGGFPVRSICRDGCNGRHICRPYGVPRSIHYTIRSRAGHTPPLLRNDFYCHAANRKKRRPCRAALFIGRLCCYPNNQALAALISLISSGTTLYRSPTMP